jgi:hypothetical protein
MININEGQIQMARELVSKRELIRILNNELSKYEECEDCHFDGVMKYEEEEGDGCNWLGANVKFRCSGEPDERCRPFISRVLSAAGKQYNIKK